MGTKERFALISQDAPLEAGGQIRPDRRGEIQRGSASGRRGMWCCVGGLTDSPGSAGFQDLAA